MTKSSQSELQKRATNHQDEFGRLADEADVGIVQEFYCFLRDNKRWWLTPIVVVLLLFGTMIAISGSAAAPFIYTLW